MNRDLQIKQEIFHALLLVPDHAEHRVEINPLQRRDVVVVRSHYGPLRVEPAHGHHGRIVAEHDAAVMRGSKGHPPRDPQSPTTTRSHRPVPRGSGGSGSRIPAGRCRADAGSMGRPGDRRGSSRRTARGLDRSSAMTHVSDMREATSAIAKALPGFRSFPTHHCVTGSMLHVYRFHHHEVSEDMLLGLGAGIGFFYWHQ